MIEPLSIRRPPTDVIQRIHNALGNFYQGMLREPTHLLMPEREMEEYVFATRNYHRWLSGSADQTLADWRNAQLKYCGCLILWSPHIPEITFARAHNANT